MRYCKNIFDGYIESVSTENGLEDITEQEYKQILEIVKTIPHDAPDGYYYKLRSDTLTWELVEIPPCPEPPEEDASDKDYQDALEQMGVTFNENP